jgi:polyketide cyclase/dehydrase/lipid transport protein
MAELSTDLIIAALADQVWEVIGRRFDRIGDWATAIPHSTALPSAAATTAGPVLPVTTVVHAPVPGRVCRTGIRLVPQVTETLIAYDDANRTLTCQASGLPAFVILARNTWTVTAIDAHHSRVSLRARFDTAGPLGLLGRWPSSPRPAAPAATSPRTCATTCKPASRHLASNASNAEARTGSPRGGRPVPDRLLDGYQPPAAWPGRTGLTRIAMINPVTPTGSRAGVLSARDRPADRAAGNDRIELRQLLLVALGLRCGCVGWCLCLPHGEQPAGAPAAPGDLGLGMLSGLGRRGCRQSGCRSLPRWEGRVPVWGDVPAPSSGRRARHRRGQGGPCGQG